MAVTRASTDPRDQFRNWVGTGRLNNIEANRFFVEFFELCEDYEKYATGPEKAHFLGRMGRLLAHLGYDPFPGPPAEHPENT